MRATPSWPGVPVEVAYRHTSDPDLLMARTGAEVVVKELDSPPTQHRP